MVYPQIPVKQIDFVINRTGKYQPQATHTAAVCYCHRSINLRSPFIIVSILLWLLIALKTLRVIVRGIGAK